MPDRTPFLAALRATQINNIRDRLAQMSTYEATSPPEGATCQSDHCRSAAVVRLIIPRPRLTADGVHTDADAITTWDNCDLHWPGFRDVCVRSGHTVLDRTGDLRELASASPEWAIFASDGGRLYASRRLNGHGTTVDAYLVGPLRAQMQAVDADLPD